MYRVLDLFCGAGGAAMGLHRAWEDAVIIGVDNDPQPNYPFTFVQGDAMNPPFSVDEFDFIWASPPCQKYTGLQDVNKKRWGKVVDHPDLVAPVRRMLVASGKPYVIENVQKSPILTQIILCGASLGLRNVMRHRHFESSHMLFAPKCSHRNETRVYGVYGRLDGRRVNGVKGGRTQNAAKGIAHARELLGIDWMDDGEIQEAVPPAYSEYIARQIRPC